MSHRFRALTAAGVALALGAGVAAAASSPSVQTGAASSIRNTSAVLNGTVNPNGSDTTYFFQWGLTSGYGVNGRTHSAGSGTSAASAQATATGLIPGTRYHFRLVAQNRFGISVGSDHTFTTTGHPPPSVATGPATELGTSFATLTGIVNPHNATTSWAFQYGTTTSYGVQTFGGTVPAGPSPLVVSSALQGLRPGTVFHYRLVAAHGSFISFGADQTFMTFPRVRPRPALRAGTRPRRDRSRPFVFITSGSVHGPSWIPAQFACAGNITLSLFHGRRRVAFTLIAVRPNCTFAARTVLRRRPRRAPLSGPVRLGLRIHFRGTGYLAPANAHHETVTIG